MLVDLPLAHPLPCLCVATSLTSCLNAMCHTSAEMLVDLPLAYFLPPNATIPGQLPMALDFEQTRWVAGCTRMQQHYVQSRQH